LSHWYPDQIYAKSILAAVVFSKKALTSAVRVGWNIFSFVDLQLFKLQQNGPPILTLDSPPAKNRENSAVWSAFLHVKGFMEMAYLELDELTKHYGAVIAADHVSLGVKQGEFLTLLGSADTAANGLGCAPPNSGHSPSGCQ